ncbi:MAG TPA: MFS transporter [Rhizobiaceae bacterium]|nr:MFS transporter [Rhizobiaceae bacterium]
MTSLLIPIFALIMGSAFLMTAGGLNGLILPLRGSYEGFSTLSLGLLGTGWAIGYVAGCLRVPKLVRKVGHVRTFGVMAALATISVLLSLLILHPWAWIPLRALTGFSFAGAAMIVESWLNERTENKYRGRIFGVYTMVNLLATTAGQMMISLGETTGFEFFVMAALFYVLALVPTALSTRAQPKPLVESKLDLKALILNSPIAVAGAFLVGISNSSFGTLGVVYGQAVKLDVGSIALMMSLSLLAGSLFQIPVGMLSDRRDRRTVLAGIAILAAAVDLYFIVFQPSNPWAVIIAASVFGGAIYSMYPVLIAHAYDHATPDSYLRISGGLLLVFGIGAILGPLLAGLAMDFAPASGLFVVTLFAHLALAGYALYRMTQRVPVVGEAKKGFVGMGQTRLSSPGSGSLDPRAETAKDEPFDDAPMGK